MTDQIRPYRSVLYIPGSNERALEKAKNLPADAIIFDLEDAVAPDAKIPAREHLSRVIAEGGYGRRTTLIRINGLDSPWWKDDLMAFSGTGADAILLPKAGSAADIRTLDSMMTGHGGFRSTVIWAMIESPSGILNAAEIAKAPRMAGFVLGTNDLAKDLGATVSPDRSELQASLQIALLAARAAGIVAVDGVYNAFKDEAGLIAECEQGARMGYDGKSLIHPAQVGPTNSAFSPSEAAIDLARRQIEAFEAAEAEGKGIAVVDGKIVENLHVATARKVLAIAEVIAEMESAA